MFDIYKAIKYLEKEGDFSQKQAASIARVISDSVEQSDTNIATMHDIESLKRCLVNIETNTNKSRVEYIEFLTRVDQIRTKIAQDRASSFKLILCAFGAIMALLLFMTGFWMSKYIDVIKYVAQYINK